MSSPPGIIPITQTSFANGTGNARDSAAQSQADMNSRQQMINQAGKGRKRRHTKKGGTNNQVAVPQFQMQYTPTGGPGTNPNDQITSASSTGMQSAAWSANDSLATQNGGRRRYRKGGNSDWNWGCYSGGKSRKKRTKHSKRRKHTRRHRRH